jgi:hypothetical protein
MSANFTKIFMIIKQLSPQNTFAIFVGWVEHSETQPRNLITDETNSAQAQRDEKRVTAL